MTVFPPLDQPYPYQRGTLTTDGRWMPLMGKRATEVFNDYSRVILCCGPRKSSKTMSAICNRIVRHAWEVPGCCIGIIGKTVRNAGAGLWQDLLRFTIPGWIESGIGLRIVCEEKMTSDSHMRYIRLGTPDGNHGEIQLHSLDHDQDVEKKFKSMRFSMIAISEVDQFKSRIVMDILLDQLRMTGISYGLHQLISDCNPPEEGKDHWLYNALANRVEDNKQLMPESAYYHFTLDDNPFLSPEERQNLERKYTYDPVKYARFVQGRWVKDMTAGHFDKYFNFNIHVVGDCSSPNKDEWEVIVPDEKTTLIITGSDIGDVNHATTFLMERSTPDKDVVFDLFDEVVSLSAPVSLRDFTKMLIERMDYWEWYMKKMYGKEIRWRHWADSSVMNYRAGADRTDAMSIYQYSESRISMFSAKKGPGSVAQRVNLVKRLLHEDRIYISANCINSIDWMRNLRRGRSIKEVVQTGLDCRHAFDSATYAIAQEIPLELESRDLPVVSRAEEFVQI